MIHLHVILDGDGALKKEAQSGFVSKAKSAKIILLRGGTVSGKPTVTTFLELDNGTYAVYEMSLALLEGAVKLMRARACSPGELPE